jgi:putative ABC transport system substrate-binding protein
MARYSTATLVAALLSATCLTGAAAQSSERIHRLGHLAEVLDSERLTREYSLPELAKLGFVEGRNLQLFARSGTADTLPKLARELLIDKPEVIIAVGSNAARAAQESTSSVPIVMFADDPIGLGLATSFARPDRNVTGIANLVVELLAKRLELVLEVTPKARRVATLLRRTSATRERIERALRDSAARAGIELLVYLADGPADYLAAFAAMRADGAEALVVGPDPRLFGDRELLAAHAREAHLPTSCEWPTMARAGCLLGYGANQAELRRRLAQYVARILAGAKPSELPIEQPTTFDLAINLKTAHVLGLTIPPAVLQRADEVIE